MPVVGWGEAGEGGGVGPVVSYSLVVVGPPIYGHPPGVVAGEGGVADVAGGGIPVFDCTKKKWK